MAGRSESSDSVMSRRFQLSLAALVAVIAALTCLLLAMPPAPRSQAPDAMREAPMESPFADPAENEVNRIFLELQVYSEDDYRKLSRRDRFLWDVVWFDTEVMNGGIWQYFRNSAGDHWAGCLEALGEIGAKHEYSFLKAACELFPNGRPSADREERKKQIAEIASSTSFDELVNRELGDVEATSSASTAEDKTLDQLMLDYYHKAPLDSDH